MAEGEESTVPIKAALDVVKAALEALHLGPEHDKAQARAGPLVVVGRLYISLTLILAVVTSAGAVIDWKTYPHEPSYSVAVLRLALLVSVGAGLLLGVVLVGVLLWRHALLLFNPAELSAEVQQVFLAPRSKEAATKIEAPSAVSPVAGQAGAKPAASPATAPTEAQPGASPATAPTGTESAASPAIEPLPPKTAPPPLSVTLREVVGTVLRPKDRVDGAVRFALGCILIGLATFGPRTAWGWIGIIPLLTGLAGLVWRRRAQDGRGGAV